jgi:hypothetical protein
VADEDIYVLDTGRQRIERYRFDLGLGLVSNPEGQVVLQQGEAIGGAVVGSLADMAWQPLIPGFEDRPSLLVLDRNNQMFRYDRRVEGASLLSLVRQDEWRLASQVQTYQGRIYVADEGAGQVYRYSLTDAESPPTPWFAERTRVNLAGLVSMEIDGDIWLLFDNGMLMRYSNREQVPFSLESSVGLVEEPADMYITVQNTPLIYLADVTQERIMVFDKSGTYQYQLASPEGNMLAGLSGLYIDEVAGAMYILTQSALYRHPLIE